MVFGSAPVSFNNGEACVCDELFDVGCRVAEDLQDAGMDFTADSSQGRVAENRAHSCKHSAFRALNINLEHVWE
jgi:hypothetical protein